MTDSKNLATALAAFQAELPRVGKGSVNTHFGSKYADLADVSNVVLPLLGKHGLSFSAKPTMDEAGRFVLAYTLRHVSGDHDSGSYPLLSTGTPQQVGSAITYARRYALCAVTGVAADEDDDGQAAASTRVQPQERHEHSYDPAEQEMLRDGFVAEIESADSPEQIAEIGQRVMAKKRKGELSPVSYNALDKAAAKRLAELRPPEQPATVAPPTDALPSRRRQELDRLNAGAAKRKETADATPTP